MKDNASAMTLSSEEANVILLVLGPLLEPEVGLRVETGLRPVRGQVSRNERLKPRNLWNWGKAERELGAWK